MERLVFIDTKAKIYGYGIRYITKIEKRFGKNGKCEYTRGRSIFFDIMTDQPSPSMVPIRILLVEDNETIATMYQIKFEKA